MSDTTYLQWPFFEARHAQLARELDAWAHEHNAHEHGPDLRPDLAAEPLEGHQHAILLVRSSARFSPTLTQLHLDLQEKTLN